MLQELWYIGGERKAEMTSETKKIETLANEAKVAAQALKAAWDAFDAETTSATTSAVQAALSVSEKAYEALCEALWSIGRMNAFSAEADAERCDAKDVYAAYEQNVLDSVIADGGDLNHAGVALDAYRLILTNNPAFSDCR